jgi:putative addiction module killer protein
LLGGLPALQLGRHQHSEVARPPPPVPRKGENAAALGLGKQNSRGRVAYLPLTDRHYIACHYVVYRLRLAVIEVRQTEEFALWLRRLRDANAVARIVARIRRMEFGNLGDSKSLRGGLMEMRIDYGPGYRVYYVRRGAEIMILLCAGDKRTQQRDIKRARELAERL